MNFSGLTNPGVFPARQANGSSSVTSLSPASSVIGTRTAPVADTVHIKAPHFRGDKEFNLPEDVREKIQKACNAQINLTFDSFKFEREAKDAVEELAADNPKYRKLARQVEKQCYAESPGTSKRTFTSMFHAPAYAQSIQSAKRNKSLRADIALAEKALNMQPNRPVIGFKVPEWRSEIKNRQLDALRGLTFQLEQLVRESQDRSVATRKAKDPDSFPFHLPVTGKKTLQVTIAAGKRVLSKGEQKKKDGTIKVSLKTVNNVLRPALILAQFAQLGKSAAQRNKTLEAAAAKSASSVSFDDASSAMSVSDTASHVSGLGLRRHGSRTSLAGSDGGVGSEGGVLLTGLDDLDVRSNSSNKRQRTSATFLKPPSHSRHSSLGKLNLGDSSQPVLGSPLSPSLPGTPLFSTLGASSRDPMSSWLGDSDQPWRVGTRRVIDPLADMGGAFTGKAALPLAVSSLAPKAPSVSDASTSSGSGTSSVKGILDELDRMANGGSTKRPGRLLARQLTTRIRGEGKRRKAYRERIGKRNVIIRGFKGPL